jgi:hypothetical protein
MENEKIEKPMIYSAMAKILAEVGSVSKDRKSIGKFTFAYRGIDDVMNALHEAFGNHGVFITQRVIDHNMEPIEGRGIHHTMTVQFSFCALDGSSVNSFVMGECIENGDKGTGKCMSYALKTCLLQTFLIPTEDESKDPDSTNQPITQPRQQYQPRPQQGVPPSHRAPPPQTPAIKEIMSSVEMNSLKESIVKILETDGYDWLGKTGKSKDYLIGKTKDEQDISKLNSFWTTIQKLISSEG